MSQSSACDKALGDTALLADVVAFTELFFPAAWAHYEDAEVGKLVLLPPSESKAALASDYKNMRSMFFSEPPALTDIFDTIRELELRINSQ
jgi:hypothetical protein